jgi:hypothetical protein
MIYGIAFCGLLFAEVNDGSWCGDAMFSWWLASPFTVRHAAARGTHSGVVYYA